MKKARQVCKRLRERYPYDPDVLAITADVEAILDNANDSARRRSAERYAAGLTLRGNAPKRGKVGRPSMVERMEKNGGRVPVKTL